MLGLKAGATAVAEGGGDHRLPCLVVVLSTCHMWGACVCVHVCAHAEHSTDTQLFLRVANEEGSFCPGLYLPGTHIYPRTMYPRALLPSFQFIFFSRGLQLFLEETRSQA